MDRRQKAQQVSPGFFARIAWRENTVGSPSASQFIANAFDAGSQYGARRGSENSLNSRTHPWVRSASDQRIFDALVQAAHSVAVELLLIDLQVGLEKKVGWELLDGETDGIRGARKSSVPNGLTPPPDPAG
jgi:hypothetical protein